MPEERPAAAEFAARLLDPSFCPQAFAPRGATSDVQVSSVWHGTDEALKKLGLRLGMAVRVRDLTAVLSGRHVRTGVRVLPAGEIFDLIFRAPNSLSYLWSQLPLDQRRDIEDAMMDSSALMLGYLVGNFPVIGGIRLARSFAASLVLHAVGTLSATNDPFPPLLHVHCLLVAVMEANGTLTLPDEATLYNEGTIRPCDTIGEARLAEKIIELGYPVKNTVGQEASFEIAVVPQDLLDAEFWQNTGCAVA